ncbi:MAG TPA: hypothetical protein VJP80_05280 [Candidatus Saccharimonadales bacterium]|nr:hypothetical protein [Candidatus Saccharimonadales bacterium]
MVVAHLLLLSLAAGTSLPALLDGQWGVAYTNDVVGPAERLAHNLTLNNILIIGLWGVVGLGVYILFEFFHHFASDWRHAEHDIELTAEGHIINHPMRRTFLSMVLWRVSVLCVAAISFIAVQPLIQHMFSVEPRIVLGALSFGRALAAVCFSLIIWIFLAHGFVVLLRLFLMRTRIFGDPDIE